VDVVFSENLSFSHRPSQSSFGAGLGFQYAPERVWFLFNHVHDCEYGIGSGSDSGLGSGVTTYFVGNVLHNLHHTTPYNPETASSQAAIMLRGGLQRYIVNNTIYDVDSGVATPSSAGALFIINNIIGGITERRGQHVFIEHEAVANASAMRHNLLEGSPRIRWGGDGRSAVGWQRCANCRSADPLFVAPGSDDFRILPASPAVDGGAVDKVYALYEHTYGVSIARDASGSPRPRGASYDLGAYEAVSQPKASQPVTRPR
jgi:hypothetical protein